MFKKIALSTSLAVLLLLACTSTHLQGGDLPGPGNSTSQGFPDFGFMVSPATYHSSYQDQPIFRLKTDYPATMPGQDAMPDFLDIDFSKDPEGYLLAVRSYAFAGNLPEWDPHTNQVRQWYHIPWLHPTSDSGFPPYGGTEGFRGLIKEAPVSPQQLAPTQVGQYQVYAVTLINEFAGYTMGQMWKNPDLPDPSATDKRYGGGFPHGAVFAKLLFTDAPQGTDKVPYLTTNPLEWTVYISESWNSPNRVATTVRLLQMDVMVRDPRADEVGGVGWVLGTFAYNGEANNDNRFENLIPLGIMWGNDPGNTTNASTEFPYTSTKTNPDLKETVVFSGSHLPPQHLGWNSRLNGPADLTTSSCMSCHMAAQYPALSSLVPPNAGQYNGVAPPPPNGGDATWMQWFQNIPCATPMDPQAYSTDFSLQVAISLENFFAVRGQADQGLFANEYNGTPKPISRGGAP